MKKYFKMGEILEHKKTGYIGFLSGIFFFETLTLHYLVTPITKLISEESLNNFNGFKREGNFFDPRELNLYKHDFGDLFILPENILDVGDVVKDKKSDFKGILISITLHEYGVLYGTIDYPEKEISKFTYFDSEGVELIEKHFFDEDIVQEMIIN